MISGEHEINIFNFKVKSFMTEILQNRIQFYSSERANESIFVFSWSSNLQNVVQKLYSLSTAKIIAEKLQKEPLSVSFNLNVKSCDGNDLNDSWQNLPISNDILAFFHHFSTLIRENCIRSTQNILIYIEQKLKLKTTVTNILTSMTKIIQLVVVMLE